MVSNIDQEARVTRASEPNETIVTFNNLPHGVALYDADAVGDALQTVLPGWGMSRLPRGTQSDLPLTTITRHDERYGFRSWWARAPLSKLGLAGATCGAVADLVQAYVDARPGVFALHCGAVRIGAHLVAFTGTYRAGKTTLVTRLGIEPDCELFCDDVLPIDDGGAVALGVQPRLRLPVPDTLHSHFRDFVARNMTVHDHRYGYVTLPKQAPLGTRAPLRALILLSRQDGAPARFHRLEVNEAAAHLIRQNIADPGEAEAHYDQVSALAEGLTCLTLVYSDIEDAVSLIRKAFIDAPGEPATGDLGPSLDLLAPYSKAGPADLDVVFRRSEDVAERIIGSDTFLWQMDRRDFFSLNPVGGAVWALLETPASGHEIAHALHEVFPDVPIGTVADDLALLLGQMQMRGLVTG